MLAIDKADSGVFIYAANFREGRSKIFQVRVARVSRRTSRLLRTQNSWPRQ